jgi:TonB family protein
MHYTRPSVQAPARWWWFASVLVHASLVGVVTVAPARPSSPRGAIAERTEFELLPRASEDRAPEREAREADAGTRVIDSRPERLGGVRSAQNVDSSERGEGGDRRSLERGRLLATRAERAQYSTDVLNAREVDQAQRIRTGRRRESWQNDRRTPNAGDDAYVSLSTGELWFRANTGRTAAEGALVANGAATRAGAGAETVSARPQGDTEPARATAQAGSIARLRAGLDGTSGAERSPTGIAARAQANVQQGHASTTAERLAPRPQDDEDAAALASSLARDALNATVHDGPERAQGVGGVGGGGRAGSGGGVGEGGRARAFGEGDGALSLSSPDPRFRRYFLALRRALERRVRGTFPEEAALALREGRVMVELRVETSGTVHVARFARRSGIAEFDANVERALEGASGPAIPPDVSAGPLRVVFDHSVESPLVR